MMKAGTRQTLSVEDHEPGDGKAVGTIPTAVKKLWAGPSKGPYRYEDGFSHLRNFFASGLVPSHVIRARKSHSEDRRPKTDNSIGVDI